MRFADFICIGAQKAGTTWLFKQLENHPQIYMKLKEVNYFYTSDSLDLYAQNFEGANCGQLCGDISPNYSAFEGLEKKVYATCPGALILLLLRNPVDRAYSQWKMARMLGNIPGDMPFIESFRRGLQYMRRRGEYVSIIAEYTNFYPLKDRLDVFWYDDVRDRPAELLRRVMKYIGVDSNWSSSHLYDLVWPSPEPSTINAEDALEVQAYYKPFDAQLRSLLRVERLPWDAIGG